MSFHETSVNIIKEAITNAIFVDDDVLLPFENPEKFKDYSRLYHSFRENDCLLELNRYSAQKSDDYQKLLTNKDLLILDWHLDPGQNLLPTFDILDKALQTSSLHFCVIYTDQSREDLEEKVILNLAAYYSGINQTLCTAIKKATESFIDDSGLEVEEQNEVKSNITRISYECLFNFKNPEALRKLKLELQTILEKIGGIKTFSEFIRSLDLPEESFFRRLICLGFVLGEFTMPLRSKKQIFNIGDDKQSIQVNNLLIKAVSKREIDHQGMYTEFMKALASESNIFLTILGLEIRNRYRETSAFIGNELNNLNNLAFFFHRNSHFKNDDDSINKELFNEFLKDIWKDQVGSFLLEKEIKLFDTIDEYIEIHNINDSLKQFDISKEDDKRAIATLNWVYNRLSIKRKVEDEIRFGDIFFFRREDEVLYLLCITPICDCLRSKKINNNFFFVIGNEIGISKGVQKTDGDFISYIKDSKGSLTCIDWAANLEKDCKPFTIYVENNKLSKDGQFIQIEYLKAPYEAKYLCTIKENYAQRIANRAFSYPMRVGIDFASFKS